MIEMVSLTGLGARRKAYGLWKRGKRKEPIAMLTGFADGENMRQRYGADAGES